MKKIALLATLIIFSCSKEEESKPQPIVYPITFTDGSTPNGWEYSTTDNSIVIYASFNPAPLIDTTKRDNYIVQLSSVSDFKTIKNSENFTTTLKIQPIPAQISLRKSSFQFNKVAYFRVRRVADSISSETRMVNINWK